MALVTQESLRYCVRCHLIARTGQGADLLESLLSPTRLSSRRLVQYKPRYQRNLCCRHSSTTSSVRDGHNELNTCLHNMRHESRYQAFMKSKLSQLISRQKHILHSSTVKELAQEKVTKDAKPVASVINELNLEVPTRYQGMIDFLRKTKVSGKSTLTIKSTPDIEAEVEKDTEVEAPTVVVPKPDWRPVHMRGVNVNGEQQVLSREQHDFAEAIRSMHQSLADGDTVTEPHTMQLNAATVSSDSKQLMPICKNSTVDAEIKDRISWKDMLQNYSVSLVYRREQPAPPETIVIAEERKKEAERQMIAKTSIDKRTTELMNGLKQCTTNTSRLIRLEELCKHMMQYPDTQTVAIKNGIIPLLLRLRMSKDQALREQSNEGLCLAGHVDPVKGRGIRLLSLDGGGTRGLATIEMLKYFEQASGKPIHELFDYVCGVSTGALIAIMVSVFRVPLSECSHIYEEFARDMFAQNKLEGARKLVMSHAYYDTKLWEELLKENIGDKSFLETSRDINCPKISAVSNLVNQRSIENYMFRNYCYPAGRKSHYPGSVQYKLWQAIRASSAAPGYYEEYKLDGNIHQDGGLLTNNPTALAIHECRQLWPDSEIQCVVSLGTGKHRTETKPNTNYSSLKDKLLKVIQSATDTESVHHILMDLLPSNAYYRLNPELSDDFQMDETRQHRWDQMIQDTQLYCNHNQIMINRAAHELLLPKHKHQEILEWLMHKKAIMTNK